MKGTFFYSQKKNTRMKKSKKNKADDALPGYPHYPESDDILSNEKRVDTDVENLSRSHHHQQDEMKSIPPEELKVDYSPEIMEGTEADVTVEDLKALGTLDGDQDEGEDETLLPNVKIGPDYFGDDLDVPGSELDDDQEDIGSEDEENNYYSRGQD